MSLHLANLSPRVRKDELELEFRRFGRCALQLKDGYGFAVYDFREDAEKALRTLKGKKICGQSVYLSWSNKQPKSVPRLARANGPRDMKYGKNFNRGGNIRGHNFSRSHGDHRISDKHLVYKSHERHQSADDHWENFNIKDSPLLHYDQVEGVFKEGDHVEVEHNPMDNGRWGEQDDHLQNDSDFDRYDPVEYEFRADKKKAYNRKRRERDDEIEETHDDKKSRQLTLSHLHSDCISPEFDTISGPNKPLVGARIHSRSASPLPGSHSANSRSNSRAHRSRSKSLKTKSRSRSTSRSRSRSPSSSLSISLGRSLPDSPNKSLINLNGFSEGALTSPSKEVLTKVGRHFEPEVKEENLSIASRAEPEPTSSKLHACSHLSISTEEMYRVLKHYGLKHPEDNEQYLALEDYFGSSRMWPWEMIYYRRLKKGSISVENYARRVAQNKAFNITDKYIRSSSGWSELIEEDH